jgi:hypothetical protein
LIVVLIIVVEWLLLNARGAESTTAAVEDRAFVGARLPSRRSLIPGPWQGLGTFPSRGYFRDLVRFRRKPRINGVGGFHPPGKGDDDRCSHDIMVEVNYA